MNKKLIALAIASAMTVPAFAYAEASVSGQANVSIDNYNDGAATASASAWQFNSNQSRVVIKGSEDLGNGLTAMYQLDNRFTLDDGSTGTSTVWSGNTYVGVKSNDFGTVQLGNIDTAYKSATRGLDLFFDVAGDNRASLGGLFGSAYGGAITSHDSRVKNALNYTSPNLSGFTIAASTAFGGENPVANSTKGTRYALAGNYKMDNIYATVAFDSVKLGTTGTGDLGGATAANLDDEMTAFKVGGSYSMDAFTVNGIIEMANAKIGTPKVETKNTTWQLAGKFAVNSTDDVKLAYTHRGKDDVAGVSGTNDATQFAIGYDHSMSKATSVYAHYTKISANGTTADPSVLSFGLKHAF